MAIKLFYNYSSSCRATCLPLSLNSEHTGPLFIIWSKWKFPLYILNINAILRYKTYILAQIWAEKEVPVPVVLNDNLCECSISIIWGSQMILKIYNNLYWKYKLLILYPVLSIIIGELTGIFTLHTVPRWWQCPARFWRTYLLFMFMCLMLLVYLLWSIILSSCRWLFYYFPTSCKCTFGSFPSPSLHQIE